MRYNKDYYKEREDYGSAAVLSKLIVDLFHPKTAVDVGCASGLLLSKLKAKNIKVVGIDGPWINKTMLRIPQENFVMKDITKPIRMDKKFDICICLETAEHIEEKYADILVTSLTNLSDVVFFSAAIPMQLGKHHVNLQWQSYWASIFKKHQYQPIDCVRGRIWDDNSITFPYRQNTVVYVRKSSLKSNRRLRGLLGSQSPILDVVHPVLFISYARIVPEKVTKTLHHFMPSKLKERMSKADYKN